MHKSVLSRLGALTAALPCSLVAQKSPVTIEDAISMVRIQQTYSADDRTVTFSPDGSLFATLIWRGDIPADVNHYSVLVFDATNPTAKPRTVLSVDYSH